MKMPAFTSPLQTKDFRFFVRYVRYLRTFHALHNSGRLPLKVAVIGFPKCGTTSIHRSLLSGGSLTSVPYELQPHRYFAKDFDQKGITLLKNPNLVYEPWWLYTIDRVTSGTKYVICLRDPQQMLRSFYWYRRAEIDKGAKWIQSKRIDKNHVPDESAVMLGTADLLGASRVRANYPIWIKHLTRFIDPARIHFVVLEELATQPLEVEKNLNAFLGFDTNLNRDFVFANQNKSKPSSDQDQTFFNADGFFDRVRLETKQLIAQGWGFEIKSW